MAKKGAIAQQKRSRCDKKSFSTAKFSCAKKQNVSLKLSGLAWKKVTVGRTKGATQRKRLCMTRQAGCWQTRVCTDHWGRVAGWVILDTQQKTTTQQQEPTRPVMAAVLMLRIPQQPTPGSGWPCFVVPEDVHSSLIILITFSHTNRVF